MIENLKNRIKTKAIYEAVKSFTHEDYKIRRAVIIRLVVIKLTKLKEENNMKSWETTIAGLCGLIVVLANSAKAIFDGDPSTNVDFALLGTTITTFIGLWRARDNNKSSEDAGVK